MWVLSMHVSLTADMIRSAKLLVDKAHSGDWEIILSISCVVKVFDEMPMRHICGPDFYYFYGDDHVEHGG
jgi:hypothetical protein